MVAWAIHCHGVRFLLHYLDDFLFLGEPDTLEAPQAVTLVNKVFSHGGILVATQYKGSFILGDFPGHYDRHQFVPVAITH